MKTFLFLFFNFVNGLLIVHQGFVFQGETVRDEQISNDTRNSIQQVRRKCRFVSDLNEWQISNNDSNILCYKLKYLYVYN